MNKEILWNIINSLLAGALVMIGACTDGQITGAGLLAALIAGLAVAVTKFKDFWANEEKDYTSKINAFSFISF